MVPLFYKVGGEGSVKLTVEDVFKAMCGEWTFARSVSSGVRMQGVAEVWPMAEAVALFREWAEVRLPGGETCSGRQSYVHVRRERGFDVLFSATGELFEEIRFAACTDGFLRAEARHTCGEDLYLSAYAWRSRDAFEVEHRVLGPRKDYSIRTIYRRAPAASESAHEVTAW